MLKNNIITLIYQNSYLKLVKTVKEKLLTLWTKSILEAVTEGDSIILIGYFLDMWFRF